MSPDEFGTRTGPSRSLVFIHSVFRRLCQMSRNRAIEKQSAITLTQQGPHLRRRGGPARRIDTQHSRDEVDPRLGNLAELDLATVDDTCKRKRSGSGERAPPREQLEEDHPHRPHVGLRRRRPRRPLLG